MFFDVIFMVQHYALYPDENVRDDSGYEPIGKTASDSVGGHL
jgi:hypothetical protein